MHITGQGRQASSFAEIPECATIATSGPINIHFWVSLGLIIGCIHLARFGVLLSAHCCAGEGPSSLDVFQAGNRSLVQGSVASSPQQAQQLLLCSYVRYELQYGVLYFARFKPSPGGACLRHFERHTLEWDTGMGHWIVSQWIQ
jgi:hypothetical protein